MGIMRGKFTVSDYLRNPMSQTLRITFLGTGTSQGVPVIACDCAVCTSMDHRNSRLRSSVMIEQNGKCVVIDTGPDFRQQMLIHKIKAIDGIVFTHEHKDHIAGLDEVRAFNYFNKWRAQVYCTAKVEEALRREFAYAFADVKYPGIPEIDLRSIDNRPFDVEGIVFQPIEVKHMFMPVFGYRIGDFTYITDANSISEEEKNKIKGSKILVLNALRHEKHPSHFNLQEAIELASEIGAEQTYFTHISHQLGLHEEVDPGLPKGMYLAYDGLRVSC
jgi:phosphoribosyl 1,2-cyclic phosphate phosphodiesterase